MTLRPRMVAWLLLLLLAGLAPAAAHAVILASEPASGTTLTAPPAQAALRFNSRIDQSRSRLTLIGPDGAPRELVLAPLPDEPTRLAAPLPAMPPGAWRLRWQVLAVDGHITRGEIPFRITAP